MKLQTKSGRPSPHRANSAYSEEVRTPCRLGVAPLLRRSASGREDELTGTYRRILPVLSRICQLLPQPLRPVCMDIHTNARARTHTHTRQTAGCLEPRIRISQCDPAGASWIRPPSVQSASWSSPGMSCAMKSEESWNKSAVLYGGIQCCSGDVSSGRNTPGSNPGSLSCPRSTTTLRLTAYLVHCCGNIMQARPGSHTRRHGPDHRGVLCERGPPQPSRTCPDQPIDRSLLVCVCV